MNERCKNFLYGGLGTTIDPTTVMPSSDSRIPAPVRLENHSLEVSTGSSVYVDLKYVNAAEETGWDVTTIVQS